MKNKYIYFGISIIVLIVIFILHSINYSILDINADNFEKLKLNKESVYLNGLDYFNPEKVRLSYSFNLQESISNENGLKVSKKYLDKSGITMVVLYNEIYNATYKTYFNKNMNPFSYTITTWKQHSIKNICDNLILQDGFVLKRSEYLDNPGEGKIGKGWDILIKETKDSFIICLICSKYDKLETDGLTQIIVNSYNKNRFF
jgi:hypothetical protein